MKFAGFVFSVLFAMFLCSNVHAQGNNPCINEAKRLQSESARFKNYDAAIQKANECVTQSPKAASVYIVRAAIYTDKGDFDLAMADISKAVQIDPKSADVYHQRGLTYRAKYEKDYDKQFKDLALADFAKAIELDPKKGESYLMRAVMHRNETGTGFSALIPEFNKAIEVLTGSTDTAILAQAYYERGYLYSLIGDSVLGNADYDTALKIKPDYSAPLLLRATMNKIAGKLDAALVDYNTLIKMNPSATAYSDRGAIYEQKHDMEKAIADYRAAFALDPSNGYLKEKLAKIDKKPATPPARPAAPPANGMTAEQYAAQGRDQAGRRDFDGAIKSFSECLRLQPDAQACYAFRGYAYGLKGDLPTSMEDFDKAIKMNPDVPVIYYIRGIMFAELGKQDRAIEDFRRILKIDPNNQQAQQALQKLGVKP